MLIFAPSNSYADETSRPKKRHFSCPKHKETTHYGTAWRYGNASKDCITILTARSAVYIFCQIVMNYKKMKERIERKEEAVKNLIEFLANENDYSSMMTELAIAQSSVMKLAETARIHGDKGYMEEIYTFFITITDLLIWIEPLSDFAKIEKEDE